MDAAYQVFIERPAASDADAVGRLARAMAARYGMREADLVARLSGGRLRVKATDDLATAESYRHDLEAMGAVCAIVDGAGRPVGAAPARPAAALPPPNRAVAPALPRPPAPSGLAGVPPRPPAVQATPGALPPRPSAVQAAALPPRPSAQGPAVARTTSGNYQSGLSAAFSAETGAPADLGALSRTDDVLSLSDIDGSDAQRPVPTASGGSAFGPPPSANQFAPPEADEVPMDLELAAPPVVPRTLTPAVVPAVAPAGSAAPPRMSGAQPAVAPPPSLLPSSVMQPVAMVAAAPTPGQRVRRWLRDAPTRFVVGVVVVVLLGFVPAHLIGGVRERAAFAALDAEVRSRQAQVQTTDDYARLDGMRATWLARKREAQSDLAMTSLLLWGLVGGGLAFAWFRKLDWAKLTAEA